MDKSKKPSEKASDVQEISNQAARPAEEENLNVNPNHTSKKEALGRNTKR